MKVYLINPKFPVTYWGFEYSNDLSGFKYTSPPLGLATVAALTPADIEVEICDENIEAIDFDKECDIVGLTAYLVQGPRAFHIAQEFRKRGKLVVIGGPITSLDLAACLGNVDVTFIGEAEYTWKHFLEDYQNGSFQSQYVQKDKVDMRDSPVPRFDLLKLDQYTHADIQTTRGCPFNCEFCDIVVLFGRKVRCKDVSQVIAELREVVRQSLDSVFFTDDNFVGNKKYAKALLRAIIAFNNTLKLPLQCMTQVSINLAKDEELLQLMYEAGFTKVFVGIETPRQDSLKEANKGQNLHTDLVADIQKIQSYNIGVSAGMIVGFDHDDVSIFQEQFDFIMETNIAWAMTGILQAVPKTPLYERLKRENRLDTSAKSFEINNTALEVNIIPKNMTKEELITGYKWLLRQLYSYENYAKRVIGSFKVYTKKPSVKFYLPTLPQLKIVLRTLRYYLLTWDRRRRKFSWDILKYVLLHKPYAFYDAMVHLVSFKHLHTFVYEQLEKAMNHKAITVEKLEQSVNRKVYAVSTQAVALYEELKKQAATVSKQTVIAYEELSQQTTSVNKRAAETYEELSRQAVVISERAAEVYEQLNRQAAVVSQYATETYEKFSKPAAVENQPATEIYEEFGKYAAVKSKQAAAVYEELRKHAMMMSRQVAIAYEELGKQAASISQQAATFSKQIAAVYKDLEKQATEVSQKAGAICEEIEGAINSISPAPVKDKIS